MSVTNVLEQKPKLIDTAKERVVLAGIIKFGSQAFVDVDDILKITSFTDKTNQAIYIAIKDILTKDPARTIDYPTLVAQFGVLNFGNILDKHIEQEHLKSIFATDVTLNTIRPFAGSLRKLEIGRQLISRLKKIQGDLSKIKGDESLGSILGMVESPIFEFVSDLGEENAGPVSISDGLEDLIEHLINNPRELVGISTGWPKYDLAIGGGLRRKTVNMVGARMKVGKSQICLNIANAVSLSGIPVLYVDTEMSKEEQQVRRLALTSGIEINKIERGNLNNSDKAKIANAIQKTKQSPFFHENVAGCDHETILGIMRRWIHRYVGFESGITKDCVIILDYLKLMNDDDLKNMQEYQKIGFIMTNLHNFAVKYDVPIFVTIQLNRDGINKESTDIVSQSDRILWLCSNFSIFKHKTPEEIQEDGPENGNRKLIPLVCRHGEGLPEGDYINMQMDGRYSSVKEVSAKNQIIGFEEQDGEELSPF